MKKGAGKKLNVAPLRLRAEDRLKEKKPATDPIHNEIDQKRFIHELQVHQVELEMQNEELNRARDELEEILEKYTDLYDFAPIGYLTFDEKALISELNLTAAHLLGIERTFLGGKPFSSFIQQEFQDRFYFHLQEVLVSSAKQTCELVIKKKDGTFFDARLESIAVRVKGRLLVRSLLIDITKARKEEEKIRHLASFPERNPNPVMEVSVSGEIIYCNPASYRVLEDLEMDKEDCHALLPEDIGTILSNWDRKTTPNLSCEVVVRDRILGETIQFVPEFQVARIYARDITERKRNQNRIFSLTKLYIVLSRVNEIIVRTRDEGSLFRDICYILAEEGGFPLAWIGMAKGQEVIPVASCGKAADYLREIKVEISGKLGKGPTGTCIRENRAVINDDFATNPSVSPWYKATLKYGFHASAAFPLHRQGKVIGAFTIYALEANAFDREQIGLLESLSADISYALDALQQERLRAQSEENLILVKETWERTFASVPDLIAILDNNHRILQVNEAMAKRLGVSANECIGLPCFEAVHGLNAPPFFCPHSRTIKDGKQHVEEIHEERLDGDFEVSTTPIYDDKGQMTGSVHIVHDITERKQADASIRRSLERFALLAGTAGQLLQASDPRRAIESVATRVMKLLDCQVFFNFIIDDEMGKLRLNAYAGIPEKEGAKIEWLDYGVAVCGCAAKDNCRIVAEHIPTTPDDRTELVKSYGIKAYAAHPLQGLGGKVLGTLSFGTRNRETFSEDDLSLMRAVADQVATAMVRMQAEEAVKAARDELEQRVQQRTAELSDAYDELQAEVEGRKKTEEALRQAHKMEAIGTLAGGIAHDFNNILAAIMGFTEMLIEDLPEGGEEEKNLRYILKSAHRGKDLVKQILAFSRKSDYVRCLMSLTPLIKETIQLLRASIPTTIKIVLKLTATSDTVLAYPTEIQQMLMNLATNAALAMEDEGGTLEISLNDIDFRSDSPVLYPNIVPGEYVQLAVRDTGIGMTPELMKRIFEPFFTTREVGKGTGMGLAMVYGIVMDLHGTITVESEPGVGSVFRVFLPKAKSGVEYEPVRADVNPGGKEHILFLDDEELLVEWGQVALTRMGYKVTSMTDSIEALKIFSADPSRFDLIVTDQTMPNLTGTQLAQKILKMRPDMPIILCTGHTETVTLEEVQAVGIREFLTKPVNKTEFAHAIRRTLDARSEESGSE